MTIVEFYDKNAIENIAGAFICKPERVVLVGGNEKQMKKSKALYGAVLEKNGINTAIETVHVEKNTLENVTSTLTAVIEKYDDCIPAPLLRRAYAADRLRADEATARILSWANE